MSSFTIMILNVALVVIAIATFSGAEHLGFQPPLTWLIGGGVTMIAGAVVIFFLRTARNRPTVMLGRLFFIYCLALTGLVEVGIIFTSIYFGLDFILSVLLSSAVTSFMVIIGILFGLKSNILEARRV